MVSFVIAVDVPKGSDLVFSQVIKGLVDLWGTNERPFLPIEHGLRGKIIFGNTEVQLDILIGQTNGDVVITEESLGRINQFISQQGNRFIISPGLKHQYDHDIEKNVKYIVGTIRQYTSRNARVKAFYSQKLPAAATVPA